TRPRLPRFPYTTLFRSGQLDAGTGPGDHGGHPGCPRPAGAHDQVTGLGELARVGHAGAGTADHREHRLVGDVLLRCAVVLGECGEADDLTDRRVALLGGQAQEVGSWVSGALRQFPGLHDPRLLDPHLVGLDAAVSTVRPTVDG